MKQTPKRLLSWLLVICMVLGFLPTAHATGVTWEKTDLAIAAEVSDRELRSDPSEKRDPNELVRVSIVREQPSAVEAGFATMGIGTNAEAVRYQAELLSTQQKMAKTISVQALQGKKLDVVWNMTLHDPGGQHHLRLGALRRSGGHCSHPRRQKRCDGGSV